MQLLQTGPQRYQPDPAITLQYAQVDQRKLAFFVGLVAFCLPLFLWIGANVLWACFQTSISHFYFAQFWGGPFIGALSFIGAYLIVYKGENRSERHLANVAGICAFGVALLPTSGNGCDENIFEARALVDFARDDAAALVLQPVAAPDRYFQLFPYVEFLHVLSATTLFAILAWFSLFIFTRVVPERHVDPGGKLQKAKAARNKIYKACGVTMLAAMAVIALVLLVRHVLGVEFAAWDRWHGTFWMEGLALWAFGLSWMVKGRFLDTALRDAGE